MAIHLPPAPSRAGRGAADAVGADRPTRRPEAALLRLQRLQADGCTNSAPT